MRGAMTLRFPPAWDMVGAMNFQPHGGGRKDPAA